MVKSAAYWGVYYAIRDAKSFEEFCGMLTPFEEFFEPIDLGRVVIRNIEDVKWLMNIWKDRWSDAKMCTRLGGLELLCYNDNYGHPTSMLSRFNLVERGMVCQYEEQGISASTSTVYKFVVEDFDKLFVVVRTGDDSLAVACAVFDLYRRDCPLYKGRPSKYTYDVIQGATSFAYDVEITFQKEEQ